VIIFAGEGKGDMGRIIMVMKRQFSVLLICCALAVVRGGGASADDYQTIEQSSPQEVVDGMAGKAGRGLANIATGWLELPKQIYTTYKEDGTAMGIFLGPLKGLGMTVVRTVSGVGELATFFVAYPGFYEPYFDPPYVWQNE
jgi:putative exosortase-associated protein (TIGR04073 family)